MTTNAKKVATMTGADCSLCALKDHLPHVTPFAPCHAICPQKYTYYMHQYYDIPEHKKMGDISIVTKKSTGLAKNIPQRIFLYELSKKNPPAELGPTSPEVGVDSRFGWGFIYRVPEKKDSSSGIAAKNWISEKKSETCELVCRNANIFTYRRTSLAHFLLFLRPICELHTLLGEITEKPLIISELSPKSDVQSIFTGFITLLDRGKLQYISEGITHSSWMILRVATGHGNKKEKWLSVFSATGNKKHDQYRKRCAILNSILAKCIPGYSLNGIRYEKNELKTQRVSGVPFFRTPCI